LPEILFRRLHGELAREQEISSEAGRDVDDLAARRRPSQRSA